MKIALGVAACLVAALTAYAIVTVDENGNGFVGKGDVQTAFGWNNQQLQANAENLKITYNATSTTVTEVSWICTNENNENIQERERTTTTESTVSNPKTTVARLKNQITGFNLTEGVGETTTSSSETEGPPLNSCPGGPWTLTTPAGDPVVISEESTRTLTVCLISDPTNCNDIAVE